MFSMVVYNVRGGDTERCIKERHGNFTLSKNKQQMTLQKFKMKFITTDVVGF